MTGAEFEGVDLDLLADYVGGALLGTPDEERVASLIADDPAWHAAFDELAPAMAAVGTTLLDLPPEPMPEGLAARLDAMFRPVPAGAPGESAEPVPAKVLDLAEHRRRRWASWAKPVAVAAGVLAFAGFGLTRFSSQSADDAQSTAAGSSVADAEGAPMVDTSLAQILHTDTDYGRASLGMPGAAEAGSPHVFTDPAAPGEENAAGKSALSPLFASNVLLDCLDMIARENAGGPLSVALVDYARFEGAPALIVQFTAANGGWTWAVGPDCGTRGAGAAALHKVPVR
ncbi:hypothetical protein [Actinoplanes aureus]|uniref:Uncharacterized protein n=1 Tax=Actinoplanes aureus TaxID=2792083 RepID=A0A931C4R9_9ACTN|nr:hypothetical protein [Actinoplanes aureus]MBG0560587.1 hypothetical protein [Actinoplanes aureus]